ncbi:hypothetical protein PYW07_009163 [Mythimna separata]|uniref:Uncharacterized protein n=1 Tax=Mythimna separata TaxID=271217 RepID=A0AAD7YB35_MYTSE|nr:hypothetical protein PYW07_009163 [Mythimna separata]
MLVLTFVVIIIVDLIAESMARKIATLLLLFAFGSCMEMRETVERTVMVRTTGSDLQPAATGYIYKKESDGPASVVKMGESEVIEHFSKMYGKSEAYKASAPAGKGLLQDAEEDEDKAASHASEEHVKPVVENVDEHDDPIDGIAAEDYDKIFEEYAKKYGSGYKDDFPDYLHGLGHFDHGIYHEYGGGKDYGSKGYHGYGDKGQEGYGKKHHFEKGNAGNYHSEKHEGYSVSKKGGDKSHYDTADAHGKHFAHGHGYKGDDHGHKAGHDKGEAVDGFHKVYDKNEFKKDHDFYDGEGVKGDHHKYANGHAGHGSEAGGYEKGGSHDSGHHEKGFGKGGFVAKESGDEHDAAHSAEEGGESHHYHDGKFGAKGGQHAGKSFGYEVKH